MTVHGGLAVEMLRKSFGYDVAREIIRAFFIPENLCLIPLPLEQLPHHKQIYFLGGFAQEVRTYAQEWWTIHMHLGRGRRLGTVGPLD